MKNKSIVLTGFMAVGKSSVGRQLAKLKKYKFVDTDYLITEEYGMSVDDIFKNYGETEFRQAELRLAEKLSVSEKCVISTGGGMVTNDKIIKMFLENSYVVNMTADVKKILCNASRTDKRPLLRGKSKEEVKELMDSRKNFYEKCHFMIDTTDLQIKQTAKIIADKYNEEKKLW